MSMSWHCSGGLLELTVMMRRILGAARTRPGQFKGIYSRPIERSGPETRSTSEFVSGNNPVTFSAFFLGAMRPQIRAAQMRAFATGSCDRPW